VLNYVYIVAQYSTIVKGFASRIFCAKIIIKGRPFNIYETVEKH